MTRVTDYHQDRHRELEARGLLPAPVAVAPLFEVGAVTANDRDLDAALAVTGDDAAGRLEAREALNRLGYLWSPPGQLPPIVWIAGIPSLTTYVGDHARPRHGDANAETPSRARDSATGTATAPITRHGRGDGDPSR